MRPSGSRTLATKFVFSTIILASAIAGFAYFQGISPRPAAAASDASGAKRFSPPADVVRPETVSADDSPWLNLRSGKPVRSEYTGPESAISLFESGSLRPTAIIAADANFDGFADAVSGYSSGSGGVITLHRAAREALAPESPESLAGIRRGEFPSSFEREAAAIDLPISPDFLASGRFRADSDLDIVVASRASSEIYLVPVDGKGGFGTPVKFDVGGEVTAMAAETFDPSKAFAGIVFGTRRDGGFRLAIADGSSGFDGNKMRFVELAQPADSLILASPDGATLEKDLFILGGGQLGRIVAVGKNSAMPESIDLPVRVRDLAAGEFIRDRRAKTELAVLADNGVVYYFKNGPIDTRPFTESEMRANFAKHGRGRSVVIDSTDNESSLANDWSIAEESNLGIVNPARETAAPMLVRARVTGNETDDLIVIDPAANKVRLLFKEPNYDAERSSFTGATKEGDLASTGGVAAVLPIRLNVMGQQGIAMLESGRLEPTPILFAPQATFTVTKTADSADGVCNADCSLREAIIAANGAAGADIISFGLSGTHQLTITGINENGSSNGDLDITQATTITGNGSLNTILQAGSTSANGIDKVMSINPTFTSAFATSITGVTIRNGRNVSPYSGDGFGGGFDWEGSGTGTLSIANAEVSTNSTTDGDGGGIVATNSSAGNGTVTINSCVISSNAPGRSGASSPVGGGVFIGTATPYLVTGSSFVNNTVNGSGGQGQGGGIFAFGPGGTGGNSFISGTSVTGNTAPSDAGGLYSTQRVDIQAASNFVSNSSGRFGGAIFVNHGNTTSSITKTTIRNNSATTTGSGIYLGSTTTANLLNVSFSRIVNNTGAGLKGLATAGGTANAENNWWGCGTTPTAGPCDTVGTTGSGSVDADPWLQLRLTASPTTVTAGQTSALTASFLLNSAGTSIAASNLDTLIGTTVVWGATLGSISSAQTSIQSNGTATATYNAATPGPGTATATVDNGPATANITVNAASADLAITKTDGATTEIPGTSVTYTITASNAGPSGVTGATVADMFPAAITGVSWTCVGAGGGTCTASGSGNINDTVNLPSGGSVTYTATGTISAAATGTLSNTATVSSSVADPQPGNNSATDTDTLTPQADIAITKTDGVSTEVPGTSVTYTIVASNAGPSNAPGSTVADTFPATITGISWTCVGAGGGTCAVAGTGNISDTVNLPSGGSVTYTATGTISASATGTLVNTATVAAPGGVTDPTSGNNSATDTDTLTPQANLAITKTDGVTTVTAGGSTTYTITASNAGPSNAPGSTVADTFPASLTGTWTCVGAGGGTCTAAGSGNINDTVNLPVGGSVTYTVSATISAAATGTLSNTATVATAGGVTDPTPGNNSATDTDTITVSADLSITKTNGVTTVTAGTPTTYTIVASNAGPSNVSGVTVADTFPAAITGVSWTCVGAGGGTCSATGLGNINDTVNLPAGGSVTYTATGTISAAATGTLSNTATVSSAADPNPGNNSATDTDTITPSDTVPPTATSAPAGVNTPGGTSYVFTVTYADNTAINVSTLDSSDVIVTGPSAFSAPATFVTVDNNTNGTPRTATYSITPPGGTWDAADNGTYSVVMQASQVSDTIGNFVAAGTLGTFQVLPLTLTVDRTDDSAAANACTAAANDCSLRGAISRANIATTNDTINFDPTVFATPQTIVLANTELVLNNSGTINIVGPGADKVTIDGNNATRILVTSPSLVATVSGIRFTKGNGVGTTNTGRGGAVYNTGGNLTMNGVIITGNAAPNGGGFSTATNGTTTIINSWIYANAATGSGGGGQNFAGSTLNVINTSITNNTCASTTSGGGGIQANGTVFVTNSTIGGNTATGGSGGGIFYNGTGLTITNSTIAGNTSTNNGGGVHATVATGTARNSIIAGNNGTAASVDVTGTWVSNGNNIIGVVGLSGGWVASDLQNTDPLLAPLGYYGGNGLTFALTSASPAINAAQGCVLTLTCTGTNPAAAITLDQRGAARIGGVDIGSFELNNSANGGSYVAVLPSGLQNSPYSYQLTGNNGPFVQVVTVGTLPNGIVLASAAAPETATSLSGTPTVFGVFNFGVTSSSGPNFNLTNYTLTVFAAAGSPVFIEGRLTDTNGQPVRNASVILTDTGVFKRTTLSSPLGYYRFENVPAGPGYTVGISSKRYTFTPVNFTANLNITGLDLVGTPLP